MLKNTRTALCKAYVKLRMDFMFRKFDEINQFSEGRRVTKIFGHEPDPVPARLSLSRVIRAFVIIKIARLRLRVAMLGDDWRAWRVRGKEVCGPAARQGWPGSRSSREACRAGGTVRVPYKRPLVGTPRCPGHC